MAGVEFVMQIRYFDADGNAKVLEGEEANRVVSFSSDYVGTIDNASSPKRLVIAPRVPLEDRVAALEAQLAAATSAAAPNALMKRDGSGSVNAAAFKGNIQEASAGVRMKILAHDGQEVARFGLNGGNPAIRFYDGGTMVLQQNVPGVGPTADDVANVLTQTGLAVGV
jgi:hypothetical protein